MSNCKASEYISLTELLKKNNIPVSAQKMNQILVEQGFLIRLRRYSMKDVSSVRWFHVLSGKGLKIGKNIRSQCHPVQTIPMFDIELAPPLLRHLSYLTVDRDLDVSQSA